MTAESSEKLAKALDKAGYTELAAEARTDAFHDFLGKSGTPVLDLYNRLMSQPQTPARDALLARIKNGDFDATAEESDAWAKSDEGLALMRDMVGDMVGQPVDGTDAPTDTRDMPMKYLARQIEATLPGQGFCLLVFEFGEGDGKRSDYISNAHRTDMVAAMFEHAMNMGTRMTFEERCNMLQSIGDGVFGKEAFVAVIARKVSAETSVISNQPRPVTAALLGQAAQAVAKEGLN